MDAAFDRLKPRIRSDNVNRKMFEFAYECVSRAKGDHDALQRIIEEETEEYPHLKNDLVRYCKLVQSVR